MDNIVYANTNIKPVFYKDIFIIYMNIIKDALKSQGIDENVVNIMNNDLVNVNRAPLVLLRRVDSPQPAAINNINEKSITIGDKEIVNGANNYSVNLAIFSYGNSYIETERIGSIVQEALITTSVAKIRKLSKDTIMGHMFLGWSGTNFIKSDSKLMSNRIDIRIQTLLKYTAEL